MQHSYSRAAAWLQQEGQQQQQQERAVGTAVAQHAVQQPAHAHGCGRWTSCTDGTWADEYRSHAAPVQQLGAWMTWGKLSKW